MACPPGKIQIRRDTYAAWAGNSSVVLAPGELAFAYPDSNFGYPQGVLKIGLSAGSTWANSTQIFPSTGSGGGGQGPTGPSGVSAYQFISYNGTPTITYQTSTGPGGAKGYSIAIKTSTNDQVLCVNPILFNVNVTGVAFSCILPDTGSYGGTVVRLGFGQCYASITNNQVSYWIDDGVAAVQTNSYDANSTLSVVYSGNGSVTFTLTSGATKTTYSTTTVTTTDYAFIGYITSPTPQTTTITGVNVYTIGVPGPIGPIGPTGPVFTPTTLVAGYNIYIQSVSGQNITINSLDMANIMAVNQRVYIYFTTQSYSNITNGGSYYVVAFNKTNSTIQISATFNGAAIVPVV